MKYKMDLSGKRFGRLTVLEYAGKKKSGSQNIRKGDYWNGNTWKNWWSDSWLNRNREWENGIKRTIGWTWCKRGRNQRDDFQKKREIELKYYEAGARI